VPWLSRFSQPAVPNQSAPISPPVEQVVDIKQTQRDLQLAIARSLEQEGDFAQASERYRQIVKLDDMSALAWHRLAVLEDRQGRCQEAVAHYRKALSLSPKDSNLLADFGYNRYLCQQWADSETYLRQAISENPSLRRAHNNLGLLLAHTNRYGEAEAAFRQAGLTEAEIHSNLAFAAATKGDLVEAQRQSHLASVAVPASPSRRTEQQQLANAIDRAAAERARLVPVAYNVEQPPIARPRPLDATSRQAP